MLLKVMNPQFWTRMDQSIHFKRSLRKRKMSRINLLNHLITLPKMMRLGQNFKRSWLMLPTIFSSLRRKYTRPTRLLLSYSSNLKRQRSKLNNSNSILLISSRESQFIFLLRRTKSIESLPSSSTTTQREQSWRSCLWGRLKVSINLEPRE